jgi:hypothetical protein
MTPHRQLKRTIADLKIIERKCFGSRQRFAFYGYLAAVFEFYASLRRNNEARTSARRIARLFRLRKQQRTHSIRVIIDATTGVDQKTKSRWSRALRYAWHERKRWKQLAEFSRSNGGPAGCAEKFAAVHKRENCRPRIGGVNVAPKLSPIVDAPIFKLGQLYVEDGKVFARPDVRESVGTSPQTRRFTNHPSAEGDR